MTGFTANPTATVAEQPLAHGAFFPGMTLSALRDAVRLPAQATDARLIGAAVGAMATIDVELASWKAEQIAAGFATLAAVAPDDTLAGAPRLVRLYERALASFAAADLADTHSDISATADGLKRIDDRALTADEHRRNGTYAIRDIRGVGRTAVELI